jgi:hypothetical protein
MTIDSMWGRQSFLCRMVKTAASQNDDNMKTMTDWSSKKTQNGEKSKPAINLRDEKLEWKKWSMVDWLGAVNNMIYLSIKLGC